MKNIKTYNAIAEAGLKQFNDNYQINQTDNADGYLIRSVDLHEHQFPENLKVIARCGAGYNNIPLDKATEKGIAVFNTPGSNANAVKEAVIGLMLVSARNLIGAAEYSANNGGGDISLRTEKDKTKFSGSELLGKKLAVIGAGHVGSLVANAAEQLGMKVDAFDPYLEPDAAWQISNEINRATDLNQALKDADYVTIHLPKNNDTIGLINDKEIKKMKKEAVLINFARGGIVDDQAVIDALDKNRLKQYISDFGNDILLNREDVIVTPHIGGSTLEAEDNGAIKGAHSIMQFLELGDTTNSVNLPNLKLPFNAKNRITLIHKNIPNMVGQITKLLADLKINIENMGNGSKDKIAYTIIDINDFNEQKNHLEDNLNKIDGMIKARIISK
ncbi:3-phosphoglycerate dehydrogenase [Lactobacillus sp. S2-2]|uniref:phosphoglycerate dehydrogenase n=1 Tax=Lactobacillus sp. S2-2 TaxID=2692917 RepID=UPI001F457689|nr:3-phosphoglycerate dehydrogenase [Lactobacillus sp. S2-2]